MREKRQHENEVTIRKSKTSATRLEPRKHRRRNYDKIHCSGKNSCSMKNHGFPIKNDCSNSSGSSAAQGRCREKKKRQDLLESGSIKTTQRQSMNRRKKKRFHLLACGSKSGAGFRVGLLAPKDTTWGRGILKNVLIKKLLCVQLLAQYTT